MIRKYTIPPLPPGIDRHQDWVRSVISGDKVGKDIARDFDGEIYVLNEEALSKIMAFIPESRIRTFERYLHENA